MAKTNSGNTNDSSYKAAKITAVATIAAAVIGGLFLYFKPTSPSSENLKTFIFTVKVQQRSPKGLQPIAASQVKLEVNGLKMRSDTENSGDASFQLPVTLLGQRASVTTTTPQRLTKTFEVDLSNQPLSMIFD